MENQVTAQPQEIEVENAVQLPFVPAKLFFTPELFCYMLDRPISKAVIDAKPTLNVIADETGIAFSPKQGLTTNIERAIMYPMNQVVADYINDLIVNEYKGQAFAFNVKV